MNPTTVMTNQRKVACRKKQERNESKMVFMNVSMSMVNRSGMA